MKYMRFPRGCNGFYAAVTTARRIALPFVPATSTSCRSGAGRSSGGISGQTYHLDRMLPVIELDEVVVSDPLQWGFATTRRHRGNNNQAKFEEIHKVYSRNTPFRDYNRA